MCSKIKANLICFEGEKKAAASRIASKQRKKRARDFQYWVCIFNVIFQTTDKFTKTFD